MDLDAELARLETLSSAELHDRWVAATGAVVPNVSPSLLRSALAWENQARAFGGLSRETTRKLDQLASGLTKTTAAENQHLHFVAYNPSRPAHSRRRRVACAC